MSASGCEYRPPGRSRAARTRRWVTAWLILAALLAVLLPANSVRKASPDEIRDATVASVGEFAGAVPARDDLTLVIARFGPPSESSVGRSPQPHA